MKTATITSLYGGKTWTCNACGKSYGAYVYKTTRSAENAFRTSHICRAEQGCLASVCGQYRCNGACGRSQTVTV